jgi:hypothetical protein
MSETVPPAPAEQDTLEPKKQRRRQTAQLGQVLEFTAYMDNVKSTKIGSISKLLDLIQIFNQETFPKLKLEDFINQVQKECRKRKFKSLLHDQDRQIYFDELDVMDVAINEDDEEQVKPAEITESYDQELATLLFS